MRLRNLTMKGFKSFANETSLHFGEDVIGVVGPNGSGKSNVVDAIRWVLGEQKSSELRLEKMTDVIFNGTKKKKEAPTAQVTLTFENDKGILPSEYSTVAITRMVYRSGESEYKLNDVKCRLKDITTLLLDTGMGSNSYAIIALGMVDDILADKNHARRNMFEQAAGISKYKKRKRETENKLRATTDDLDRIEDLIFEIEGNLKSLERQAKRAQKYLDIKDKYKEISILHAQLSIAELKVRYKELKEALDKEKDGYRSLDVEIRKREAQLEHIRKEHLEHEHHVSKNQRQLNEVNSSLRDAESEKALLLQKKQFKIDNVSRLNSAISASENKMSQLQQAKSSLHDRLSNEKELLTELTNKWKKAESLYKEIKDRHALIKRNSASHMESSAELNDQLYRLEKELALLDNNINNVEQDIERDHARLTNQKGDYEKLKSSRDEYSQQISQAKKELAHRIEQEDDKRKSIDVLNSELEKSRNALSNIHRKIDSKKNEYDLLKSMVDNLEGFPESIKFLNTKWNKEAVILSDIIEVEDDYKAIIEQYLENYLNYYIVDTIDEAKEAIALLSHNQKGKAKFFLLNEISSYPIQLPLNGKAKSARYIVSSDEKYRNLLDYLFYNVMIIDDIELLDEAMESTQTYLSANGTYIKSPLSISGGSVGLFQGKKIGRKKTLDQLDKSITTLSKDRERLEQDLNHIKFKLEERRKSNFKNEIRELERKINNLSQDDMKAALKIEQYEKLKAEISSRDKKGKDRIRIAQSEKQDVLKQKDRLSRQLSELKNKTNKIEENLEELNKELSQKSELYNKLHINYIQKENLVINIEKDLDVKSKEIDELAENIRKDKIRIQDDEIDIADIKEQLTHLAKALTEKYELKEELRNKLNAVEKTYYEARNHIREEEDALRELSRKQNQIQLRVQQLRDDHSEVKFKISAVGERLKIEFDTSINSLINEEIKSDRSIEAVNADLEKLRLKLSRFGEVNPMAVESYNEMKERYDHIISQRDDIIEAKESLIKTISEIETSATEMYMESFNKVRENFVEVFRSLFSEEDDCDLILVDKEYPLESDIEIIAKPKGKKPKSLSQLSGGEKTLTATALLFSLYLLKPAPFCIFDEVDAPLDDANIAKFNKIIKKFSKDSQFIIVTHNKATMSAVDILYGVYMQEMGISQVTPVDFRNLEHQEYLETIT